LDTSSIINGQSEAFNVEGSENGRYILMKKLTKGTFVMGCMALIAGGTLLISAACQKKMPGENPAKGKVEIIEFSEFQ
jgi:hypothetical protein